MTQRKMVDLLRALESGIELEGSGIVVGAMFHAHSTYTIFDITLFYGLKNISVSEAGVAIQSGGFKVFFVYEPVTYPAKYMEPYLRDEPERIPLRWEELDVIDLASGDRILVSKKVQILQGSFGIVSPGETGFLYYFYPEADVVQNVREFIVSVLHKDLGVEGKLAARTADLLSPHLEYFDKWRA